MKNAILPRIATVLLLGIGIPSGVGAESLLESRADFFCVSEYYQVELVATSSVPGLGGVTGHVDVNPARSVSTVSVGRDGSYLYDLQIHVANLRPARDDEVYTAWVASNDLSRIVHLGTLETDQGLRGAVSFNKFLVIITLEPNDREVGEKWRGPIVTRGMSRSGFMHTMIGHGPLQEESCAVYGFR